MKTRAHLSLLMLTYLAAVAQTSLRPELAVGGCTPDFLVLAMMCALIQCVGSSAILWSAAIGLVMDCLAADGMGVAMLVASVAALLVQSMQSAMSREATTVDWCVKCAVVFLVSPAATLLRDFRTPSTTLSLEELVLIAGNAVYTVLIGLAALLSWHMVRRVFPSVEPPCPQSLSNKWTMLTE